MKVFHIVIVLFQVSCLNAQDTFVKILEQGEIKGLELIDDKTFIIAGTKWGEDHDVFIAGLDASYEIDWLIQFGTTGIDNVPRDGLLKTSFQTFLLLVNSFNYIDTTHVNVLYHFSNSGEEIWSINFEEDKGFTLKSVIELDSTYLVFGNREEDVVLQYVSKTGQQLNQQIFETDSREVVKATAVGEETICIVGDYGDIGRESIFALSIDYYGNLLWKESFNSSFSNGAEDVLYLNESWYVAGSTFVGPGKNNDRPIFYQIDHGGFVVEVDSIDTGDLQDATPFKMAVNHVGEIVFVGPITKESAPNNWKGNHFYIGKLNGDLDLLWTNIVEYDKCFLDCGVTAFWPHTVLVHNDAIISAGGYRDSMFIIRSTLDGSVPIREVDINHPSVKVYPNPASSEVTLTFDESQEKLITGQLRIYSGGREVRRINTVLKQKMNIDCTKMASGLHQLIFIDQHHRILVSERFIVTK